MIDYDALPTRSKADSPGQGPDGSQSYVPPSSVGGASGDKKARDAGSENNDDVFSDSDDEEKDKSRSREAQATSGAQPAAASHTSNPSAEHAQVIANATQQLSLRNEASSESNVSQAVAADDGVSKPIPAVVYTPAESDIKAMAADASVFSFGDEEDYESE